MNGFAGSERVGERRRRRLAVESEGSEPPTLPRTSGDGDPLLRFFANAGREASQLTARSCPVLTLISAPTWKHIVAVLAALAGGLGLVFAGYASPQWAAAYGPGAMRLFQGNATPILGWVNTLTLFTTAQAACIVWWARARSLRDFEGNYRIWGWAAATYLLFCFASATQAHLAWSETILYHIRWRTPGAGLWCWLLPASAWGWGLALRLEQELRDNRWGHWLFLTAGAWYLGIVGLLCQRQFWPQFCTAELSQVLIVTLQLLGHACLFLSTVLHARFVLCCTAEPPLSRRRNLATKASEPVSVSGGWLWWILWPSWLLRSRAAASDGDLDADGKPKKGRKRAAPKKRTPTRKAGRVPKPEDEAPEEEEWEEDESASDDAEEEFADTSSDGKRYRVDSSEDPAGAHFSESEDEESDEGKGLSKRERRRLQQQQREQERRSRR